MVGRRLELQAVLGLVIDQPAPATTLDGGGMLVEPLNEQVDVSPGVRNVSLELTAFFRPVTVLNGAQGFPEKLVVEMASPVELERLLDFDLLGQIPGLGSLVGLPGELVQVVDVGPVVLAVVETHQVAADHGFERADLVRQVLERDGRGSTERSTE